MWVQFRNNFYFLRDFKCVSLYHMILKFWRLHKGWVSFQVFLDTLPYKPKFCVKKSRIHSKNPFLFWIFAVILKPKHIQYPMDSTPVLCSHNHITRLPLNFHTDINPENGSCSDCKMLELLQSCLHAEEAKTTKHEAWRKFQELGLVLSNGIPHTDEMWSMQRETWWDMFCS